ncbi:hypothetical protein [Chryseobacterium populi]|uniref:hypothetical protein n=1 Tax=Chryseobacterium populi TaxID=1144316 RepID=UPI000553275A|nr:hypothetical protein [Chryseobacterium populi]
MYYDTHLLFQNYLYRFTYSNDKDLFQFTATGSYNFLQYPFKYFNKQMHPLLYSLQPLSQAPVPGGQVPVPGPKLPAGSYQSACNRFGSARGYLANYLQGFFK